MADTRFRLRVAYRKAGALRYLSHLETVRACERAIRRAGLPYAVTQGFNPHMRIAFGPALPVGTGGLAELYDVWLTQYVAVDAAIARLRSVTRADFAPHTARFLNEREPSLAAALNVAHYEVVVAGPASIEEVLRAGLASIVESGTFAVAHKGKQKVFELPTALLKEPVVRSVDGGAVVEVVTRIGEKGSLRPEALVMAALGPGLGAARIASVMRTRLCIEKDGRVEEAL